jgi:hypothetical protein
MLVEVVLLSILLCIPMLVLAVLEVGAQGVIMVLRQEPQEQMV